jgi:predicted anti-sigma-YlaC factor YlaD
MTDAPDKTRPEAHADFEVEFTDLLEQTLSEERRREVEAHLATCEGCRLAFEEYREAVSALSGLHKMGAPQHFEREVEATIHRRSRGRFFGRKTFGDRVPFELIAVLVLGLGLLVYFLIWSSQTGSLRYEKPPEEPKIAPDASKVVPRPGATPGVIP